jgi:hypothetical protein
LLAIRRYATTSTTSLGAAAAVAAVQPSAPRAAPKPQAAGPAKGSDVPRINIGVFGCMNAGKR